MWLRIPTAAGERRIRITNAEYESTLERFSAEGARRRKACVFCGAVPLCTECRFNIPALRDADGEVDCGAILGQRAVLYALGILRCPRPDDTVAEIKDAKRVLRNFRRRFRARCSPERGG